MEVCCLKMASRCRPMRPVTMDVSRIPTISSSHDCGSLSRVVMVRKTDQRMINHKKPEADPQCELLTYETIQTYRGHKPDRTIVIKEKHDMVESEAQKSPCAQHFLRSNASSAAQSLSVSTHSLSPVKKEKKVTNGRAATTNGDAKCGATSPASSTNTLQRIRRSQSLNSRRPLSTSTFSEFEKDCLKAHNEFRLKHAAPLLKLNKKLCRYAEEWAKIIAVRGQPIHRSQSPYGENIFCAWSSIPNMEIKGWEPVESWYSEGSSHVFGREPATLKTGHFTQVVWLDSRELGVGVAKNRSGHIFVVANYDPPGNFIGSFSENVPPIGGFGDDYSEKSRRSLVSFESFLDPWKDEDLNLETFARAILRYHNEYRRKHGVPELKLNKKLCALSQEWTETLALEDRFAHRPHNDYGENIYCLWSSDRKVNPREVCRSWYEEIKEHDFGIEPKGLFKAGHFTQMIWKSSQDLGVGMSKTKKGKVLVVCNYNPRGNIAGQFNENVPRARI